MHHFENTVSTMLQGCCYWALGLLEATVQSEDLCKAEGGGAVKSAAIPPDWEVKEAGKQVFCS